MTKRELIDEVIKVYTRFSRRDAEVMVNAGDRTIAEYFLDPILRVYDYALKED